MRDLLGDHIRVQVPHVLVLGGQVDGCDAKQEYVSILLYDTVAAAGDQVLIEDCDSEEVSPWLAFKAAADFDHPVCHHGTALRRNHMPLKRVVGDRCGHLTRLLGRPLGAIPTAGVNKLARLECFLNFFELAAIQVTTCFDVFRVAPKLLDQA